MSVKNLRILFLLVFYFSNIIVQAHEDLGFFLETGAVFQHRNDIQIPNDSGTRLAVDEFDSGPFLHTRFEAFYRLNNKHALRVVYAPLSLEITGKTDQDVLFDGVTFLNNQDIDVTYQFNSYRLSYIYGLWSFGKDQLNVGLTAKIRDAETKYKQGSTSKSFDNVGFVPLLYFEYQKFLNSKWSFNIAADAAWAPQGRAVDAVLKLRRSLFDHSFLGLGYRTLEGGADNDKLFTFSWFNYAVIEFGARY